MIFCRNYFWHMICVSKNYNCIFWICPRVCMVWYTYTRLWLSMYGIVSTIIYRYAPIYANTAGWLCGSSCAQAPRVLFWIFWSPSHRAFNILQHPSTSFNLQALEPWCYVRQHVQAGQRWREELPCVVGSIRWGSTTNLWRMEIWLSAGLGIQVLPSDQCFVYLYRL